MSEAVIEHGGERLVLLPERAVWWPRMRGLLAADLHLGRELGLRRLGVPVPEGSSQSSLRSLAALGARLGARRLVILGDLFHSREARNAAWEREALAWLDNGTFEQRLLVRGNHDAAAGDPCTAWGFQTVEPGARLGPLTLFHQPPRQAVKAALAGHVHPVLRLRGPARLRHRLPAFWLDRGTLVLPSWGEMTGGWPLPSSHSGRAWACTRNAVLEVALWISKQSLRKNAGTHLPR